MFIWKHLWNEEQDKHLIGFDIHFYKDNYSIQFGIFGKMIEFRIRTKRWF